MKQQLTNPKGGRNAPQIYEYPRKDGSRQLVIRNADPTSMTFNGKMDPRLLASVIEYRLCEMMGMAGFSYKAIGKVLGLRKHEIGSRLHRVAVKVRSYRDGETPLAKEVIARLDTVAQKKLVDNLARFLLK